MRNLNARQNLGGARLNARRGTRTGTPRLGDKGAIGLREENVDGDFDDFVLRFMIEGRLLRAAIGLAAGILDEKSRKA